MHSWWLSVNLNDHDRPDGGDDPGVEDCQHQDGQKSHHARVRDQLHCRVPEIGFVIAFAFVSNMCTVYFLSHLLFSFGLTICNSFDIMVQMMANRANLVRKDNMDYLAKDKKYIFSRKFRDINFIMLSIS